MSSTGFQEKALQNRAAISLISPTSNERMPVKQRLLDGRQVSVPPHQVAVLSEQPNIVIVNPQTNTPAAFGGSETFVDFELPDQLHVVTGLQLAMNLNFSGADAAATTTAQGQAKNAAGAAGWDANGRKIGCGLCPTPYWTTRVEIYAGKDIIETIYPEALYNDAIAWRDIQNRREWSEPLNFTADLDTQMTTGNALNLVLPYRNTDRSDGITFTPTANSTASTQSSLPTAQFWNNGDGDVVFHLPLACSLTQGKVFAAGFVVPFKVRVYFAPSIRSSLSALVATGQTPNSDVPAGTATPSLARAQLWVSEQQLSSVNFEAKLREHRNGNVLYKFIMKNRYQQALPVNGVSGQQTVQLKAFKSLSAGLVMTLTAPNPGPADVQTRYPITQAQLLDAVGRRITEVQPDRLMRRFVFPRHIASDYTVYREQYLTPFSSDFGETVRNAVNLGYNQMTTLEQYQFTIDPATTSALNASGAMINIHSYDYATLSCNGGVPQVSYT